MARTADAMSRRPRRIVVGMTGASGVIIGVRTLAALSNAGIETHLVVSKWGQKTLEHETSYRIEDVRALASQYYSPGDLAAAISSGSFRTDGMVIVPCSVRTLSAIAVGAGDHLIHRAADVVLKEGLPLVLVIRETPLSSIHLTNMLRLSRMGVIIMPPVPAFYNHPASIDEMVDHISGRIVDQLGVESGVARRWSGHLARRGVRVSQPDSEDT